MPLRRSTENGGWQRVSVSQIQQEKEQEEDAERRRKQQQQQQEEERHERKVHNNNNSVLTNFPFQSLDKNCSEH